MAFLAESGSPPCLSCRGNGLLSAFLPSQQCQPMKTSEFRHRGSDILRFSGETSGEVSPR